MKGIGREADELYVLANTTMNDAAMITQRSDALTDSTTTSICDSVIDSVNLDIALWHNRLGHASTNVLKRVLSIDNIISANKITECVVCPCAKQARLPFPATCIKTSSTFELLHMDVWAPTKFPQLKEIDTF